MHQSYQKMGPLTLWDGQISAAADAHLRVTQPNITGATYVLLTQNQRLDMKYLVYKVATFKLLYTQQ